MLYFQNIVNQQRIFSIFDFQDEIIRRRLLFDGDGTGDDKRIATIIRTIIQWSMTKCDDEERLLFF